MFQDFEYKKGFIRDKKLKLWIENSVLYNIKMLSIEFWLSAFVFKKIAQFKFEVHFQMYKEILY